MGNYIGTESGEKCQDRESPLEKSPKKRNCKRKGIRKSFKSGRKSNEKSLEYHEDRDWELQKPGQMRQISGKNKCMNDSNHRETTRLSAFEVLIEHRISKGK
jgi:hypothetical protein